MLGGDERDLHVAERLTETGHESTVFGFDKLTDRTVAAGVRVAESALDAVAGAQWIVCPAPGMDAGDRLYAPFAARPIVLDESVLAASEVTAGGLILGRASKAIAEASTRLGFRLVETKDERHLSVAGSVPVAEGLLRVLIDNTGRTLREYRIAVLGYGVTGSVITDLLLGIGCRPTVLARDPMARELARRRGAGVEQYASRANALASAEIVINTVPDTSAVPEEAWPDLREALVVDIASPPGGLRHDDAKSAGLPVIWARGLGARAPETVGDIRFRFVAERIAEH